jgi:ubiquinone/menaquinone biosynthesis C-methylase UbiE
MSYDGQVKYDRGVAATYDADREGEVHWRLEREWLAAYAAARAVGRVLDVPVGTGRLLPALTSATHIDGVDVSDAMLEVARVAASRFTHCAVELHKGDALNLSFPDRTFDTVVCFRLVHLLPPDLVEPLFSELRRVCDGRVVVQLYVVKDTTDKRSPLRRLAGRVKRALFRQGRAWAHIQSYSHSERFLIAAIEGAGLRILRRDLLDRYDGATVEALELAP